MSDATAKPGGSTPPTLNSLHEITEFLRESAQPVFYLSRSATNLAGLQRVIGGLHFITLSDAWDGQVAQSFAPERLPKVAPRGNIQVVNWLLNRADVQQYIARVTPAGFRPQIIAAMFDERTEKLCRRLGYELIMPTVQLRERLDSKIVTTELGNQAQAESVPNILTTIGDWEDFKTQCNSANLGNKLVVQLPYGDSGRTTYFINSAADFKRVAAQITSSDGKTPQLKIMRHINHLPLAVEAVITQAGIVSGRVLHEITGHPELTGYKGGWAGSEMYPGLLSDAAYARNTEIVQRFSKQLQLEGYRGILEISTLLDTDTGAIYLGELNPRISGSSAHSNLQGLATQQTLPLFAYHVLEYSGAKFTLDLKQVQAEIAAATSGQTWSTLVVQYRQRAGRITSAPQTGRYRRGSDGTLEFVAAAIDWQELASDEVFWFRGAGKGELVGPGVDVGMLITRSRAQQEHYALTPETVALIPALLNLYRVTPLSTLSRYAIAAVRRLQLLRKA